MCLSEPLSYVWGIPGSGKTKYVLATAINDCIRRDQRVAVIAPTNLALEQVLNGLLEAFEKDENSYVDLGRDVVRIGNPTAEFLRRHPSVCENRKVQAVLLDRRASRARFKEILDERRYEELRESVEASVRYADENPETEKTSETLYGLMKPLIQVMLGDPRFRLNAQRLNTRTVYRMAAPIRRLVYGRDRSGFLDGGMKGIPDAELESRISALDREIDELLASDSKSDLSRCKVVAMTLTRFLISFGPKQAGRRMPLGVDRVFVDEAGYCNAVQAMSLFSLGVPVTMLGDHMQLPPVCEVDDRTMAEGMAVPGHRYDCLWAMSALYADEMFADSPQRILDSYRTGAKPEFEFTSVAKLRTTHRFGQNLADVLGEYVYEMSIESRTDGPLEIEVVDAAIEEFPARQRRNGEMSYVRRNIAEAKAVERYIERNHPEDYIVLTPYREQLECLKERPGIPRDRVLTIHRSQGREWDTVILSVCDGSACTDAKPPRFTSTVRGPNAVKVLNTALSRAKRRLVIVCDTDYWKGREGELIGRIIGRCGTVPERSGPDRWRCTRIPMHGEDDSRSSVRIHGRRRSDTARVHTAAIGAARELVLKVVSRTSGIRRV